MILLKMTLKMKDCPWKLPDYLILIILDLVSFCTLNNYAVVRCATLSSFLSHETILNNWTSVAPLLIEFFFSVEHPTQLSNYSPRFDGLFKLYFYVHIFFVFSCYLRIKFHKFTIKKFISIHCISFCLCCVWLVRMKNQLMRKEKRRVIYANLDVFIRHTSNI